MAEMGEKRFTRPPVLPSRTWFEPPNHMLVKPQGSTKLSTISESHLEVVRPARRHFDGPRWLPSAGGTMIKAVCGAKKQNVRSAHSAVRSSLPSRRPQDGSGSYLDPRSLHISRRTAVTSGKPFFVAPCIARAPRVQQIERDRDRMVPGNEYICRQFFREVGCRVSKQLAQRISAPISLMLFREIINTHRTATRIIMMSTVQCRSNLLLQKSWHRGERHAFHTAPAFSRTLQR